MAGTEGIPEAEHVFIRGEGGSVFKLDLPLHEDIANRLTKGYIQRVANAEGDPYIEGQDEHTVTERPALNAAKAQWVGWAVFESNRLGSPLSPDDAEALTKPDLIELYGVKVKTPEEIAAETAAAEKLAADEAQAIADKAAADAIAAGTPAA